MLSLSSHLLPLSLPSLQETADATRYMQVQVAALQRGFNSLADAVIEELEAVREESSNWCVVAPSGWGSCGCCSALPTLPLFSCRTGYITYDMDRVEAER